MAGVKPLCRGRLVIKHRSGTEKTVTSQKSMAKFPRTSVGRDFTSADCLRRQEHLPNASVVPTCYQLREQTGICSS